MFMATRQLVLEGRRDRERLTASERETNETELLVLQQKLEPQLLLRVLAGIADQAERNPREAERAVEHLAVFLRKSLISAPALNVPLSDEVTRSKEYADVLEMCGTTVPITWQIDDDARQLEVPGGALSTFLNYAISRCVTTEGASITVRAYQHATRLYLIVKDNAAPDPPMLAEPEGLAQLRRRLGSPPRRRSWVETSVAFEVDGTPAGTTQTLSIRLPEAA
jgi:LytS/YehU family sensor histidine kinase